jgi:hypothetical protein
MTASGGGSAASPGTSDSFLTTLVSTILTWRPATDGRLLFIAAVTAYFGVVAIGRVVWRIDIWPVLGVPSGPSIFFDARNLTAAWECDRLGYDPLHQNPCDPWGRPLMYLRPWLLFAPLGLNQSHTFALGVTLIVAVFGSFVLLVRRVPLGTGIILALAACSPAVMFALERANMDIALFTLVTLAVLIWRAFPIHARVASPILVLLAATAKLYPVFALPSFVLTRNRRASRAAVACLAVFTIYCAYSYRDIVHVAEIATQGQEFSYGARILPAHLYHQLGADRWAGPAVVKQVAAALPLAGIAALIIVRIRRRLAAEPQPDDLNDATASLVALHVGALVYLGTFVTANNFDYRLVFLLLTLPQLMAWARERTHRFSSLAAMNILAILLLLWVGALSRRLNLWDELASWAVAGLFIGLLTATMPRAKAILAPLVGPSEPTARV